MTTYTVGPSRDFASLGDALTALFKVGSGAGQIPNGTHTIVVYSLGSQLTSLSLTRTGSDRTLPVTIRPATPEENGSPVDLRIDTTYTFKNMSFVRWDCSGTGASRFRWFRQPTFDGGCHNWQFKGDPTQLDSGSGTLEGETGYYGNHFIQYGMRWWRLNDDITFDGMTFIHRRSGTNTGTRGYLQNLCLDIRSNYSAAQARHSQRWEIKNCEFAYWAHDGIRVQGLEDSSIHDNHIHHLYPTVNGNTEHIDGMHIMHARNLDIYNNYVHHVLYQGIWLKSDNSPAGYTADNTTYAGLRGIRVFNNLLHSMGGDYLVGEKDFSPTLTGENGALLIDTGGTGMGVTNAVDVLIAHNVAVKNFKHLGLEVNFNKSPYLPASVSTPSDQTVNIVNNVFSTIGTETGGVKETLTWGGAGLDGLWKHNLQTSSSIGVSGYRLAPSQTGDIATGTTSALDFDTGRPVTGSPLLGAGYDGAVSGFTMPTVDRDGNAYPGTDRSVGAFQGGSGSATLTAGGPNNASGVVNVPVVMDATDSVGPGTLTFLWTRQSGPGSVTWENDTTGVATITATAAGTHVIRLVVSTVEAPGTTVQRDFNLTIAASPTGNVAKILGTGVAMIGGLPQIVLAE